MFTLRTYDPGDFETLFEIDQACYEPSIAYSRSELRQYLGFPGADCVIADAHVKARSKTQPRKSSAAGFCITAHEADWGYIITIDVLEPYRRSGLGSRLLAEAERRLSTTGVTEIELDTAVDNVAGIAFWKRHGYSVRARRKDYYPGGLDAFSMLKRIA